MSHQYQQAVETIAALAAISPMSGGTVDLDPLTLAVISWHTCSDVVDDDAISVRIPTPVEDAGHTRQLAELALRQAVETRTLRAELMAEELAVLAA